MSTVSFLAQLEPGILCPENAFLSSMIKVALSLELTDTFLPWDFRLQLSSVISSFSSFSCHPILRSGYSALYEVKLSFKKLAHHQAS